MSEEIPDGKSLITLDFPQRDGKPGYTGTMFSLYLRMGGIITDPTFKEHDARLYFMTRLMISMCPGVKRRQEMTKKLKEDINEAIKGKANNEEKMKARNEVCLDALGDIFAVVDLHLGLSVESRVGFVA